MGQAKNRKIEINTLKSTPKQMTKVFAMRHGRNGVEEFVSFGVVLDAPRNNKDALLRKVACEMWGHSAPVELIADYLVQTKTYGFAKPHNPAGFFIEFYQDDPDRIGSYSCRTVCGFRTTEQWQSYVDEVMESVDTTETDIKFYA